MLCLNQTLYVNEVLPACLSFLRRDTDSGFDDDQHNGGHGAHTFVTQVCISRWLRARIHPSIFIYSCSSPNQTASVWWGQVLFANKRDISGNACRKRLKPRDPERYKEKKLQDAHQPLLKQNQIGDAVFFFKEKKKNVCCVRITLLAFVAEEPFFILLFF